MQKCERPAGKSIRRALYASGGACNLALCLTCNLANAQTASQITPPNFAPLPATAPPPIVIPEGGGTVAPAGSDALSVSLADVTLDGVVDTVALTELKAALVGRSIKVSEIFDAARVFEARYARAGRVLVRIVVPAQKLADGATLHLLLVDGSIETIDVDQVPTIVRGRVATTLRPLLGKSGVTQAAIERRLLLAGDMPGVTLRSTLAADGKPGATKLVIEAEQRAVVGFVALDNTLPSALGRLSLGAGINLNSVLGAGETIYLRASGFPTIGKPAGFFDPTPRNRALAAGMIIPVGTDGLTVNVEMTDARTAPRHESTQPGSGSRFQRLSGRLLYLLVRTRALTVTAQAIFDAQNERVRIITPVVLPLSLDRLRIARVAGDARLALPTNGVATAHVQASFGIDALGARGENDATALLPLSRAGTHAGFHSLNIDATIEQPLGRHLVAGVAARGQTSFGEVMANSEQIGIAALDGISPLPSGTVQGDSGYVLRGELKAPFVAQFGIGSGQVAPYGFGAYGQARFYQPTVVEHRTTGASAYGAGVRLTAIAAGGAPGLSASIEYGHAHAQGPAGSSNRVSFTFISQF